MKLISELKKLSTLVLVNRFFTAGFLFSVQLLDGREKSLAACISDSIELSPYSLNKCKLGA